MTILFEWFAVLAFAGAMTLLARLSLEKMPANTFSRPSIGIVVLGVFGTSVMLGFQTLPEPQQMGASVLKKHQISKPAPPSTLESLHSSTTNDATTILPTNIPIHFN